MLNISFIHLFKNY